MQQSAHPQPVVILAEHVLLALVARKANPRCRWAAMASGRYSTRSCHWRTSGIGSFYARPPLLSPMQRGNLHRAIQQQRLTQGLTSIRATYGTGLRALLAEPAHIVPAEAIEQAAAHRAAVLHSCGEPTHA